MTASPFVFQKRLDIWDFPSKEEAVLLLERDSKVLQYLYTSWEKAYDGIHVLLWSRSRYWLCPLFCSLYLGFIYAAPRLMAKKQPYDLRRPLKYWNLFLAIFSLLGSIRVVPHIVVFLYQFGWQASLCSPPVYTYGRGAVGLWTMLFIYSKYFELIDTVFIILRKKKLTFLHWYHHVTVLMYTWDAFVTEQPPGIYYCGMNYGVHAVMYFYYYVAATLKNPPRWGIIVTVLQIAQMLVGVMITVLSLYNSFKYPFMYRSTGEIARNPALDGSCYISRGNMISAAAMYSTYFYLFAIFFMSRYLKGGKGKME